MTDGSFQVDGAPQLSVPFGLAPVAVVALLVALGLVVVSVRGTATVLVPKAEIPAFRVLTRADFEQRRLRRPLPSDVLVDGPQLIGRLTRQTLAKGAAVRESAVTEVTNLRGYDGPLIKLRAERFTVLGVVPGDPVILQLAPATAFAAVRSVKAEAVLMDRRPSGDTATEFVFRLRDASDARAVMDLAGRGDLHLTPSSP